MLFKTNNINIIPKGTRFRVYSNEDYKEALKEFKDKYGEEPTLGFLLLNDGSSLPHEWWFAEPGQEIQLPLAVEELNANS